MKKLIFIDSPIPAVGYEFSYELGNALNEKNSIRTSVQTWGDCGRDVPVVKFPVIHSHLLVPSAKARILLGTGMLLHHISLAEADSISITSPGPDTIFGVFGEPSYQKINEFLPDPSECIHIHLDYKEKFYSPGEQLDVTPEHYKIMRQMLPIRRAMPENNVLLYTEPPDIDQVIEDLERAS